METPYQFLFEISFIHWPFWARIWRSRPIIVQNGDKRSFRVSA